MFEVGDYIVYGNNGVCQVEKVGPLESKIATRGKVYYTLSPCYLKGSTIFTPADNQKVPMRPVMTKQESLQLIDAMQEMDALWITDEKRREAEYKEAIQKCDAAELVKIIKTIFQRKETRIAEGKKVTATDEKYFHLAEERLYGEFAIALNMQKDEVAAFIEERIKES
ncbi:MAG: CarD family transcriptional regulator [Hespellia sp.]|nr:CarD family transcriptional regulator [Hespellia sp.]